MVIFVDTDFFDDRVPESPAVFKGQGIVHGPEVLRKHFFNLWILLVDFDRLCLGDFFQFFFKFDVFLVILIKFDSAELEDLVQALHFTFDFLRGPLLFGSGFFIFRDGRAADLESSILGGEIIQKIFFQEYLADLVGICTGVTQESLIAAIVVVSLFGTGLPV